LFDNILEISDLGVIKIRKIRVLFLQPQPCIRALKYGAGLKHHLEDNIDLRFGYTRYSPSAIYGYGEGTFDHMIKLDPHHTEQSIT
jgi:hypothetical protein